MNLILLVLICGNIISTSFGALLLKIGSEHFKVRFDINGIIKILKNYKLLIGIFLYGVSSIFFVLSLRIGELSFIYPVTSASYIFISLLSVYFLREKMNQYKWIGICFIILGVALVSL